MRPLGLLGGMSWQSTTTYYRLINEGVHQALGGLHSAPLLISSIDFAPLAAMQTRDDWDAAATLLVKEAKVLERAGAAGLMICTNTMHKVADQIEAEISIPLLHIADATGQALNGVGSSQVALLGTAFTMEQPFIRQRLEEQLGLTVSVPCAKDRAIIHRVIYEELCLGKIEASSKRDYLSIMQNLVEDGAQTIVLGCTEIGLLVKQSDISVTLIDTTRVHAELGVRFLLDTD